MKTKFLEDTIQFSTHLDYHKMTFKVDVFYTDGNLMDQRTMEITYSVAEDSMSFANDDDFYGHGMHFNFDMIKKFRKHLKSLGIKAS